MFIYKYALGDHSGCSYKFLTHETVTPTQFEKLVDEIEQQLIPAAIDRAKKIDCSMFTRYMEELETGAFDEGGDGREGMRKYLVEKFNGDHELYWSDIYYQTYNVLIEQYGFVDFEFDGSVYHFSSDVVATFKIN